MLVVATHPDSRSRSLVISFYSPLKDQSAQAVLTPDLNDGEDAL